MKTLFAAALLLPAVLGVARAAETAPAAAPAAAAAPVDAKSEHARIAADEAAIRKDWGELKAQLKGLDGEAETEIKKIRSDYKSKKDAARTQTKADVKAKHDDIAAARANLRKAYAAKHPVKHPVKHPAAKKAPAAPKK